MGKNLRAKFVGMDVHQKTISIAIADDGPDREVRLYHMVPLLVRGCDYLFLILTVFRPVFPIHQQEISLL